MAPPLNAHWETVYRTKAPHEVSWFQPDATISLDLIARIAPARSSAIIDVGSGASTLVDALCAADYRDLTVIDLSPTALETTRRRLGGRASCVSWIEADVLTAELPASHYDLWHDRAVFHFLTSSTDRARYVEQARRSITSRGHLIIATFAHDGPEKCSGLPVIRYTRESLAQEFSRGFRFVDGVRELHVTPTGGTQPFLYCVFAAADGAGTSTRT